MGCQASNAQAESPEPRHSPARSLPFAHEVTGSVSADPAPVQAIDPSDILPIIFDRVSRNDVQAIPERVDIGPHVIQPQADVSSDGSGGRKMSESSQGRMESQTRHQQKLDVFLDRVRVDPQAMKDSVKGKRQKARKFFEVRQQQEASHQQEASVTPGATPGVNENSDADESSGSYVSQ